MLLLAVERNRYNKPMQKVFAALLFLNVVIMGVAIYLGLMVGTGEATANHVKFGFLASIYNMFLHCLAMFYLIGSGRDIKAAIEDFEDLQQSYVPVVRTLRKRVFPIGTFAILSILIAAFAGAWVHSELVAAHGASGGGSEGLLAVRQITGWWIHLVLVVPAIAINIYAFCIEFEVIGANVRTITEVNKRLAEVAVTHNGTDAHGQE